MDSVGPDGLELRLASLRAQLGDAIFEARLDEARDRERLMKQLVPLVEGGASFPDALKRLGASMAPRSAKSWFARWRAHGLAGLVDLRGGAPSGPRRAPPAQPQLTLLGVEAAAPAGAQRSLLGSEAPRSPRGGATAPLLKWSGSKAPIVDMLVSLAPSSFGRYHEPFVGGGSLYFALRPERAVLSDSNAELINLYEVVRDQPEPLIQALSLHENTREHYHRVRGILPDALPPVERAARTLFLNRTCYNGLFRLTRSGLFNVPYGNQPHAAFFQPEALRAAHGALRGVEVRREDFGACAERVEPGDFVYLDPPYAAGMNDGELYRYQAEGFGEPEQRRVAEVFHLLDRRGCLVMASNADCPLTRALYAGSVLEAISVRRRIGGEQDRRGFAREIVVRNYGGRRGTLPGCA